MNLKGADLRGAKLEETDLRGANLEGAKLRGANLEGADLRSANLSGADLLASNLEGANLRTARLVETKLSMASLRESNLAGADLHDAELEGANLRGADLSGAKLEAAELAGADLVRVNLTEAELAGANLCGADLSRADLSCSDLSRSNLREATLVGANLAGAKLRGIRVDRQALTGSEPFREAVEKMLSQPQLEELLEALNNPNMSEEQLELLQQQFRDDPVRKEFQKAFTAILPVDMQPPEAAASWFYCDPEGLSMVRVPESKTIGKNFAWRSYFYGGSKDMDKSWRAPPGKHIQETQLSAVFRSEATGHWIVAVTTPVFGPPPQRTIGSYQPKGR